MFTSSKQLGRIPVLAVIGLPGSGKTTFLNRLLQVPELAHSVVLTTAGDQAVKLLHDRVIELPAADFVSDSGCLCCGMRSALGDTLRELFLKVLSKRLPPIDRVVIETPSLDTAQLKFTLKHAPFLGQRYVYRSTIFVLDAQRASRDGLSPADLVALEQADAFVMSKEDLLDEAKHLKLLQELRNLKPAVRMMQKLLNSETLIPSTL